MECFNVLTSKKLWFCWKLRWLADCKINSVPRKEIGPTVQSAALQSTWAMGSVWSWSLQELCDPEAWKCSYFLVVSLQLGGGRVKEWLFWCEEGVKQHWESMSRCLRSQSLLEWGGQRSAQSASWSLTSARWSRAPEPQLVVWFIGNSFSYLKGAQEQIAFVSCGWWRQQILGMELGAKLLFGNTDSLLLLAASIFE